MKMKPTFIHIGLHKTGSTFLQDKIFPRFSNTTFISRPFTCNNHAFNKLKEADDILYNKEEILQIIENINSDEDTSKILLSDESFSGRALDFQYVNRSLIAYRLRELFPDATIIIFLRSQKNIIKSLYNQWVKGYTKGYKSIENFISVPGDDYTYSRYMKDKQNGNYKTAKTWYFNPYNNLSLECFYYYGLINFYKKLFPKVHVFLYEELRDNPLKVLENLEIIFNEKGLNLEDLDLSSKVNASLDDSTLERQILKNRVNVLTNNKLLYRLFRIRFLIKKYSKYQTKENQSSIEDYLERIAESYYKKDNQEIITKYPDIGIQNYSKEYGIE